ncbi:clathrin interactor 1-like [Carica papaya]|uniref:clathrin interactor 1-like n=1 Tax=Carica papaya TaxID=3649 RepID=UPI000B8D0189|nr:clathrin interactor 1-like [Carica papaya]
MANPIFNEFKRQASFFLKEKIKTARLVLTDVTPAQLLTEEVTDDNPLKTSPDARAMRVISQAAFEVDNYWRIVEVLHGRLLKFDEKTWRISYNAVILLDHLLTHGPLRIADEFQGEKQVIEDMTNFKFIDEKGFNWGLSVRKLSERVLKLLENITFLREERTRCRKVTRDIQGFGNFSQPVTTSSTDKTMSSNNYQSNKMRGRSYSMDIRKDFLMEKDDEKGLSTQLSSSHHPFCNTKYEAKASLLAMLP